MRIFTIIWLGQLVSMVGTAMTRFALLIWAYQQTGEATTLALLGFFSFAPFVLISPIAGVVVDRLDRRLIMIAADLGAGSMTIALLVLCATKQLQLWHLYAAMGIAGAFEAFQLPAYTAATTAIVSKAHYVRTSGMRSLAESAAQVLAPMLAGLVLLWVKIEGVLLVDVATFLFSIATLWMVRIPATHLHSTDQIERSTIWQEMRMGFHYILERRGLLGLLIIFTGMNLFSALTYYSILPAMVLARSQQSELALATVQSALGLGGVLGGLTISFWGGTHRQIHNILAGGAFGFLVADSLFGIGRTVWVWSIAALAGTFSIPLIVGSNRAIWQTKVTPSLQGRVFAVQGMFQQSTLPIGYLVAGPLADRLFEPAMASDGALAPVFGWLVGTGAGAGMALMFICTCILGVTMSLSGYLFPAVRNVEIDLPDESEVKSLEFND